MVQNAHILRVCSAFSPFRALPLTLLIFEIGSNISGMVIFEKALSHNMLRVYSLDTKARFFYINPKKASSHQSYKK
jgi:hypothetical protein